MLAQRILSQSARRLAARQPASALLVNRGPAIIASNGLNQKRLVESQSISSSQASEQILAKQRLNRPVSPHLAIYRPQITWYASALNRITGSILSGGLYVFGAAYLIAPTLGWHLESASMAAAVATWPAALKVLTKLTLAWPFAFHSLNGVRHLAWDMGMGFKNGTVMQTGWTVVGLSTLSALVLALM